VSRLPLHNGEAVPVGAIPELPVREWRNTVLEAVEAGARVTALFASSADQLTVVLAHDTAAQLSVTQARLEGPGYPSLTPECPQVERFERALAEETGIQPEGHPWLQPVRFSRPEAAVGCADFHAVEGAEVHEVAVGPVHAGSSSPVTSASNAMASACCSSRSRSATSTGAWRPPCAPDR
jgi:hypothetical protein